MERLMRMAAQMVFISYMSEQFAIADRLCKLLNNAFMGSIHFFLAPEKIRGGDDWRDTIRRLLKTSGAGLFLVTKQFLEKRDWLIAEYICFWLEEKPRFLLTLGGIKETELPSVIGSQLQLIPLEDSGEIRKFFAKISQDMLGVSLTDGSYSPPYEHASKLSEVCAELYSDYVNNIVSASDANVEYKFLSEITCWRLTLNESRGQFDGICQRRLLVTSYIENLSYIPINFRTVKGFDYRGFVPRITHSRSQGSVKVRTEETRDRFLVMFTPGLRKNETVEISCLEYSIPDFKYAVKETQLRSMLEHNFTSLEVARQEQQGAEQFIVGINVPTDYIEYEIRFPEGYPAAMRQIMPFHSGNVDAAELEYLQTSSSIQQYFDDETKEYVVKLMRRQPRYKERYNISWILPEACEL